MSTKKLSVTQSRNRPEEVDTRKVYSVPLGSLIPAWSENNTIYRPIHEDDPRIISLADDICANGQLQPLTATLDFHLQNGHSRYAAMRRLGWRFANVIFAPFNKEDDPGRFFRELVSHNLQRVKSHEEIMREAVARTNVDDELYAVREFRRMKAGEVHPSAIKLRAFTKATQITPSMGLMVEAIRQVVWTDYIDFWPLSLRRVHYGLLNYHPLLTMSLGTLPTAVLLPVARLAAERSARHTAVTVLMNGSVRPRLPWRACAEAGPITDCHVQFRLRPRTRVSSPRADTGFAH